MKPMPGNQMAPSASTTSSRSRRASPTARSARRLLHQIQKIAYDRVMFAPIWEFAALHAVGPRVDEAGLGLIELMPFSAPYEDIRLKGR